METERKSRRLLQVLVAILGALLIMGNAHGSAANSNVESKEIVDPYQVYTYELMTQHIDQLAAAYPELITVKSIGTTDFGREIKAVKVGKGEASILIDGSQHAREWMGTNLILYMIDRYAYAYEHNMKYDDYPVRQLLDQCSIWFVPMVNPDGVTLQQEGLNAFPESYHAYLTSMNGGSTNFKRWKANASGIDINRQYPAMWTSIRNSPRYPTFKNFKGSEPVETVEAQSMIHFTYESDPEIVFSYHTSGEVLYWHFHTAAEHLARDKKMADFISAMTGYGQVKPDKNPSGGGFTDWFIVQFGRPGFTAELGPYQEETELPLWTFTDIWDQNQSIGLYLASEGYKLWWERYPMEMIEEKIQLLNPVQLYNRPSDSFPVGAELNEAKITADARLGDWYRVPTWLGPKWVHLSQASYLHGHSESYANRITLKDTTPIYKSPNPDESQLLGQLDPQEVETLERWNDWILIRTWSGNGWIQEKK
ncbi:g-D-glutamyl-meso-diaminopimelate peptidase [Paenibacillus sp. 1_12]|uniref:M14 family zinc carboxypeptidase n=1 Tax=Paenibacillus sp. 1_12 TaxID=1566278 RepID=UPI0008EAB991|nr:M14 family zinc carboxypeptidase [Paenibacillus sp. 1_12]SFM22490.1 g-D-glutamyl-meso-diaminopimelate peptidase [Paenibacillus sp. 1_12]